MIAVVAIVCGKLIFPSAEAETCAAYSVGNAAYGCSAIGAAFNILIDIVETECDIAQRSLTYAQPCYGRAEIGNFCRYALAFKTEKLWLAAHFNFSTVMPSEISAS